MDRSDDLTRNRRFNPLDLGNGRTRPRIVTSRDERVAPTGLPTGNRPPQPSLEFRARQRLRTYAEASTILDRQTPRDASAAKRSLELEPLSPANTTPERSFSDVVPEPPSPMAEAYVGRTPRLTRREAAARHLDTDSPIEPVADEPLTPSAKGAGSPGLDPNTKATDAGDLRQPPVEVDQPAISAFRSTEESPAVDLEWSESAAHSAASDQAAWDAPDMAAPSDAAEDAAPRAFQTPRQAPSSRLGALLATGTSALEKSLTAMRSIASKSAPVAKSWVAKAGRVWQNTSQRASGLSFPALALPQMAASGGPGVQGRVSRLPANSLLTPQAGSLAASARADASNARADANVRPVRNEGVLSQEPEPKRTLLARKIQDDVERTESRTAAPTGPITSARRGRMALSALALILVTLVLLGLGAWVTTSILQRTNSPVTTIGETERYRIEAILDALFIDPGAVDGVIDERTMSAIGLYAREYGYSGPKEVSTSLLQHLEDEADAMGVLDLIN